MIHRIAAPENPASTRLPPASLGAARAWPVEFLILSAWCGLISGLFEVATFVVRKQFFDRNHLYGTSQHFVWLIPAADLCIFLALGVISCLAVLAWPRHAKQLAPRVLCAMTILPSLLVAFPQVYGLAWMVVAVGIATWLVPVIERHAVGFRRYVRLSLLGIAGLVPIAAAVVWGKDQIDDWHRRMQPMPLAGSPNVVLIVLDTVVADHLGLYGYGRPTSPTLDELARIGIQFQGAQATSSWTLPSHASLFTGHWPHELSANWLTPLDRAKPTLAEFLGSRGYATAGFVANTLYCASDSGLGRGFATYRDFIFPRMTVFKPSVLVDRLVAGVQTIEQFIEDWLDIDVLRPAVQRLWWLCTADRKDAMTLSREFLDWLSLRRQPERPFFAFLNFYDAHYPYQLPESGIHRFGMGPRDSRESAMIQNWWPLDKRGLSAQEIAFAQDSYDDCIAHLDEQLGILVDELGQRGVLEKTWLIIVADHGESFGEHAGVFCHGTSLYQTELHVPMLFIPPIPARFARAVKETVSLRDLAATVVDVVELEADSPFPGTSLARFWKETSRAAPPDRAADTQALSEVVPNDPIKNPYRSRLLAPEWPLAALVEGDWSYIRREGEVQEELYDLRRDATEAHNLASAPDVQPRLDQMRKSLARLTAGPLTPDRFHP
jgi:arylsulfatase A-like enzyme